MDWKTLVLAAGSAVAAAAFAYYLIKSDPHEKEAAPEKNDKNVPAALKLTKEKLYDIVQEVLKNQDDLKKLIEDFTNELMEKKYTFEQVYDKMVLLKPADPLETHGIDLSELDALLNKYQNLPWVHNAYLKIMGAFDHPEESPGSNDISLNDLINIHEHMLKSFRKCTKDVEELRKSREVLDPKIITIVAQAISSASVAKTFNAYSKDIEGAVQIHHEKLISDPKFVAITHEMQESMIQLIEAATPSLCAP